MARLPRLGRRAAGYIGVDDAGRQRTYLEGTEEVE
ncbi:hypothetical protein M2280_006138 [Prescottella agglutinans]|uniref:Transposase n=1 Tax=Prescottella agglutinans TaxID=1644129 RepID=A0ABT6MKX2_9NOCA|nr:hypothetical protein [Prescottella agglutinans]